MTASTRSRSASTLSRRHPRRSIRRRRRGSRPPRPRRRRWTTTPPRRGSSRRRPTPTATETSKIGERHFFEFSFFSSDRVISRN
jgi:hypothetical protein